METGDEVYRRENGTFREAGRRLAGARDSQVVLETLDSLTDRCLDGVPDRFKRFRRTLVGQHGAAQRQLGESAAVAEVRRELGAARERVRDWPLESEGFDAVGPGFKRIYRRGRRAYRVACAEPSTENLHELRKRTKDLWYAAQIVRSASPKKMRRIARRAHDLSNLIGEDHDLAILAQRAGERRDRFADEADVGELAGLATRRRDELRREAMGIGSRLFAKKPRKLARPLEKAGV